MAAPSIQTLSLSPRKNDPRPFALGAISDVYMGYLEDGTVVALKDLRGLQPYDIEKNTLRKNIQREARRWAKLSHKNIAPFLGYSTDFGPILTLVTPYFADGTLKTYLKHHPDASMQLKGPLTMGVADGVVYLHAQEPPIVHGDLRCSNVLIDSTGNPRLTDIGLAQLTSTSDFTTANIAGPCRWQAPELFQEESEHLSWTTKADVYSFGMLMLEIITENLPFKEIRNDTGVILAVIRGAVPRKPKSSDLKDAASALLLDKLWDLIAQCWEGKPDKRPDIQSVRNELARKLS